MPPLKQFVDGKQAGKAWYLPPSLFISDAVYISHPWRALSEGVWSARASVKEVDMTHTVTDT